MFGSTWVSCSPWAVQGDGSQDLGVLGSHPPVPLVRPPPTHTHSLHAFPKTWVLSAHPGPQMFTSAQHKESCLPHSWVPGAYLVTAPGKGLGNSLPPEWRWAAQRRLRGRVWNNGLTVTPGRQQICIFTEASGGHKA